MLSMTFGAGMLGSCPVSCTPTESSRDATAWDLCRIHSCRSPWASSRWNRDGTRSAAPGTCTWPRSGRPRIRQSKLDRLIHSLPTLPLAGCFTLGRHGHHAPEAPGILSGATRENVLLSWKAALSQSSPAGVEGKMRFHEACNERLHLGYPLLEPSRGAGDE